MKYLPLSLIVILLISACGGGSGSSNNNPPDTPPVIEGTLYSSSNNAQVVFLDSNENSLLDDSQAEAKSQLVYSNAQPHSAVYAASFSIDPQHTYQVVRFPLVAQIPLDDAQTTTATNSYLLTAPYNQQSIVNSLTTLVHHIAFNKRIDGVTKGVSLQEAIQNAHTHLLNSLPLTTPASASVFTDLPAADVSNPATSDSDAHFLHAFMQTVEQIIKSNTRTLLAAADANNFTINNTTGGAQRRSLLNQLLIDAIYNSRTDIANAVDNTINQPTGFDTSNTAVAQAVANDFADITDSDSNSMNDTANTQAEFYNRLTPYYAQQLAHDNFWLEIPFYTISYNTTAATYQARVYRINTANSTLYYQDCDFISSVDTCLNNFTGTRTGGSNGNSGTTARSYSLQDDAEGKTVLVFDEDNDGSDDYWHFTTEDYQNDHTDTIANLLNSSYRDSDKDKQVNLFLGTRRFSISISDSSNGTNPTTRMAFNAHAAISIYQALGGDDSITSVIPVMSFAKTFAEEAQQCLIDETTRFSLLTTADFRLSRDVTDWSSQNFIYSDFIPVAPVTLDANDCDYGYFTDARLRYSCAGVPQPQVYHGSFNRMANNVYSATLISVLVVKGISPTHSIQKPLYPKVLDTTAVIGNREYTLSCPG